MQHHDEKFRWHLGELRSLLSEHQRGVLRREKLGTPALKKAAVGLLVAVCTALTYWLQSIASRPVAPPTEIRKVGTPPAGAAD